jgi:glycine/D-amino acid oxidase-like deaminating enzyme
VQGQVTPGDGFERITTTGGERFLAGLLVFACGAWLPKLFPEVLGSYIFPTRQEIFFFSVPPGDSRFSPAAFPAWYSFAHSMYGMPDIENRGIKIAFDRHGPAFDPDRGSRLVSESAIAAMTEFVRRFFPALADSTFAESRVCQYENTSNGDLLIDRHPEFENVWLVGGGSGHGFKHGPAVGEYVAAIIHGKIKPEPRFSLAGKKRVQSLEVV